MELPKNIESKIKLIVFDFDGTIINLDVNWGALKKRLQRYILKEKKYNCSFNPIDKNLNLIKNKFGKRIYFEMIDMIAREEIKGVKKTNANKKLLRFIRKQTVSHMTIFSSNTQAVIDHTLKLLQLSHFMGGYIASKENVAISKPSPKGLIKIMDKYGVSAKETIFIGNTDIDMKAGKNAGVTTYIYE